MIITGYADAEEIGGRPTDVGLLMKPFTVAELSGAVHRAFDGMTAAGLAAGQDACRD